MLGFLKDSPRPRRYKGTVLPHLGPLNFMRACGLDLEATPSCVPPLLTQPRALSLGYEQAMTRSISTTGDWYSTSAPMI